MLVIYLACALIGGIFVALSITGGLEDFDFDPEADFDLDAEVDADASLDGFDDVDFGTKQKEVEEESNPWLGKPKSKPTLWLPFFSFKFWTFGLCFFGLSGLALTWLDPNLGQPLIALISLVLGLTIGTTIALILRSLGGNSTNSMTRTQDFVGAIGTVEIPFDASSRGKVQLSLKGSTVGYSAMTEENKEFQRGEQVLVVSYEDNRLWVVSADQLKDN